MRKSRVVALICGSAVAVCGRFALADIPLAVSYDDFAGTPRSDGINDPTTGPNSWQGWGTWNNGVVTPQTSNSATGETLTFAATSLAGGGPTVNGLLDTPNDYAATNGDPDYGQYPNGFGGLPGVLGSMTINNYAGGYDVVQTGDFQPGSGGAAFAKAIQQGQCLAIDFTSPDGGTTLPAGYMTVGFSTYTNSTNLSTGGANPGKNLTGKDSGAFGDAPGSFCVNNGTYFTAYIPYSDPTFTPAYGQFNIILNSSDAGNVTFSNIRLISSTWATSGGGSWTTNVSPTDTDWIGGIPGDVLGGASGAIAQFADLETGNAIATLDQTWTLGTLTFDSLQYSYNIAPGTSGSLVMDNKANSADAVINDVAGGSATSGGGSAPNYTEYLTAAVLLNSNTDVTVTRSTDLLQVTGNITGTGALSMSGAGTLQLNAVNTYSGGTTVNGGTLLVSSSGSLPANKPVTVNGGLLELANGIQGSNLALSALTITGSGKAQVADNVSAGTALGTSNVTLGSLSITGNGVLDIGNNRVIIDYSSPLTDPIASIATWIKNGFYNLAGPQIISSDIAADDLASGLSYGIGYADGADGAVAGLPSGEIEIMFTLLGDANLDGIVNSEDFTPFSANVGKNGGWDKGDFNYDGTINSEDFTPFSANLGKSATLAAAAGGLVSADGLSLANVPEPASAGLMVMAGFGILRRCRRSI